MTLRYTITTPESKPSKPNQSRGGYNAPVQTRLMPNATQSIRFRFCDVKPAHCIRCLNLSSHHATEALARYEIRAVGRNRVVKVEETRALTPMARYLAGTDEDAWSVMNPRTGLFKSDT